VYWLLPSEPQQQAAGTSEVIWVLLQQFSLDHDLLNFSYIQIIR
jgi:hypothetical protein